MWIRLLSRNIRRIQVYRSRMYSQWTWTIKRRSSVLAPEKDPPRDPQKVSLQLYLHRSLFHITSVLHLLESTMFAVRSVSRALPRTARSLSTQCIRLNVQKPSFLISSWRQTATTPASAFSTFRTLKDSEGQGKLSPGDQLLAKCSAS